MPTSLAVELVIPKFAFQVENALEVIQAMGQHQARATRSRIRRGEGRDGPLPRSKEGRPYIDSGQLLESVQLEVRLPRSQRGLPYGMVLPTGLRREVDDVGKQRRARSARRRRAVASELRARRAAGELGLGDAAIRARASALAHRQGRRTFLRLLRKAERAGRYGISDAEIRKRASRAGKLGYRQARRNMDVAAILSNPPKDKRAIAGGRGVYRVFDMTRAERREVQLIAARRARFALTEQGAPFRHRGRGYAEAA